MVRRALILYYSQLDLPFEQVYMTLVFTYALFALIAIIANIGVQAAVMCIYEGSLPIELSVLSGTAAGLLVKYTLDKHYIFRFPTRDAMHNSKTFLLYTATGIITTLIFWGFEFGFQEIFQTNSMRYLGGVMGLSIGYVIKYQLDKRHVFR